MCKINGKKLAEIRRENGLTQAQLAKKIGISEAMIGFYEQERNEPSPENLKKICMILKIKQGEIEMFETDYNFLDSEGKLTSVLRRKDGFIRYTSPELTQKWIESKRKDSEQKMKTEIKNAFNSMFSFAGKKYIQINPTYINIPDWQRDTDNAKTKGLNEYGVMMKCLDAVNELCNL